MSVSLDVDVERRRYARLQFSQKRARELPIGVREAVKHTKE